MYRHLYIYKKKMISIYSSGNHVENSANISNKEQYSQINKTKSNMIKSGKQNAQQFYGKI